MNIGIYYDHTSAWWQEEAGDSALIFRALERLASLGRHQFVIFTNHAAPGTVSAGLRFQRLGAAPTVELMWYLQPPGLTPEIMHVSTVREGQIHAGKPRSGVWNPEDRELEIMLQRAARVITDTQSGREAIVREYLVPAERIGVLSFRDDPDHSLAEIKKLFDELEHYRRCWPGTG